MADQILDRVRDVVDGQIDFDGQRRVELLATLLLSASALIAFNVGYTLQDIQKAVYIALAGTALTFLVTIPPWPLYKNNPVKWLPAGAGMKSAYSQMTL